MQPTSGIEAYSSDEYMYLVVEGGGDKECSGWISSEGSNVCLGGDEGNESEPSASWVDPKEEMGRGWMAM